MLYSYSCELQEKQRKIEEKIRVQTSVSDRFHNGKPRVFFYFFQYSLSQSNLSFDFYHSFEDWQKWSRAIVFSCLCQKGILVFAMVSGVLDIKKIRDKLHVTNIWLPNR